MREKLKILLIPYFLLLGVALLCLTIPIHNSYAAMPSSVYLGKIKLNGQFNVFPGRIAIDSTNNLYIVDGNNNRLIKTDSKGSNLGSISVPNVTAVDVSSTGLIYVGVGGTSPSVLKYSIDGVFLGSFANNIASVFDIAVDKQTGDVYVVDNVSDRVVVFAPEGSVKLTITGIHLPRAVYVTDKEIYILDSPVVVDPSSGSNTTGARVSVYDKAGSLLRSFDDFVAYGGHMKSPQDIVVDPTGNILIPETITESVLVYDSTGNYLGEIKTANEPMYIPGSIALGPDSRIYVSSTMTSSVLIFGLDGYTIMDVTPTTLSFITQDNQIPPAKKITVTNSGPGTLDFTVVVKDGWINVDNTAGTIAGNGSFDIGVSVNPAGLSAGKYIGQIEIVSAKGVSKYVSVNLEVLPPPELSVTPVNLTFDAMAGGTNPSAKNVTISVKNDPDGTISWTATANASWLSITPATGNGSTITQASVSVDIAGLTAGTYSGNIEISASTTNSPVVISVTLNVQASGVINVTTNLDAASFEITGPVTYNGSGINWSVSNVPAGTYTITFKDVPGYITPAGETRSIGAGETITFSGIYKKINRSIAVTIKDRSHNDEIKIVDAEGILLKEFNIDPEGKGELIADLGDIDGDGIDEIAAVRKSEAAELGIYNMEGTEILRYAFNEELDDIAITIHDIDNDGADEILIGSKEENGEIKILDFANGTFNTIDYIGLFAERLKSLSIDVGDVDGDGLFELVALAKIKNKEKTRVMKLFKLDTGGVLAEIPYSERYLEYEFKDIEIQDIDNDGLDDIMLAGKDGVYIVDRNANIISHIILSKDIVSISVGDVSIFTNTEIIVGKKRGIISVYSVDGVLLNSFKVEDTNKGVNVSTGYLGL